MCEASASESGHLILVLGPTEVDVASTGTNNLLTAASVCSDIDRDANPREIWLETESCNKFID